MEFRQYQNEMDDAIYQALINSDRCLVKAFCGTGKSIVMYKGKAFQNHDTLVYVFPSLSLIDQFKTDYLKSTKVLIISSDDESTTDEITIKKYMKNKNKIICITYQSFHLLTPYKINMCVFDEAHHAVGETYQKLIFNPNIEKSCFFTATPKCANGIDMVKDCNLVYEYSYLRGLSEGYLNPFEIRCDLVGDDSNKTIYESIARAYYTTGNNRILTFHSDVNTESPTSVRNFVNENEMNKAFKTIAKELSKDSKIIKIPKIKMMGFYSEIKLKERRQILNEFDSCKDVFILSSCETMGEGVDTKNANMCVFVDSKTSVTKIIQNIGRVVRKVFGINKPHSTILLPMTINKTKYDSCQTAEECDALIRQDMNKDGHNDFTSILNVLSALKQEDEDLYDICLHYPNEYSPQEIEENLKSQGYKIGEEVDLDEVFERAKINESYIEEDEEDKENYRVDIHTNSLEEPIISHGSGDKIINILKDGDNYYEIEGEVEGRINPPKQRIRLSLHTNSDIKVLWKVDEINFGSCLLDCEVIDNWNERLEELRTFLEREKRRPNARREPKIEKWLSHQFQNYKKKIQRFKNSTTCSEWESFVEKYKEYLKSFDEKWNENLQLLKDFIHINKRRPNKRSENEKFLGAWLGNQNKQYNTNQMNKERMKIWEEFLKENNTYLKDIDDIWNENFIKLKEFIYINKQRPNPSTKNKEEKFIGVWVGNQIKQYNTNQMNKERIKIWEEFWEKNKEYFKTDVEKWNDNLQLLIKFIDINKRIPKQTIKEEKKLRSWIHTNNENYRDKIKGFMNPERCKQWEDFLEEYKEYLKTDVEIWNENFQLLKDFIDKNKRRPTEKDDKYLCGWLQGQIKHYNKMDGKFKDMVYCNQWEEFLEQYKNYIIEKPKSESPYLQKTFDKMLLLLKEYINKNKKRPSKHDDKYLCGWLQGQIKHYNKMDGKFKDIVYCKKWEKFLEEYKEYLKTFDEQWNENFELLKEFIHTNKRRPSMKLNKHLCCWFSNQNAGYKKKEYNFKENKYCEIWEEFLEEYKEYFTEKKSMKFQEKKIEEPNENPQQKIQRTKSEISELHKEYKTKSSKRLHEEFQEDPEKWHHYHEIAEANEETFPTESIPRNQIIRELEKIKMKRDSKQVIDMGCGKAFISKHFEGDTRFKFTNIDHISNDETVQTGDISKLPFEDDSVEICILSLAMWGSNCKEYISEAHRVLETNGILYIIEPTKRWTNEIPADRLKELLNNFTIKKEIIEKFTMFVAIKN